MKRLSKLLPRLVDALLDNIELDVVLCDFILGHLLVESHAQRQFGQHLVFAEITDDVH